MDNRWFSKALAKWKERLIWLNTVWFNLHYILGKAKIHGHTSEHWLSEAQKDYKRAIGNLWGDINCGGTYRII